MKQQPIITSYKEALKQLYAFFKPMSGHADPANARRWRFYGWILIAVGMGFNANLFYSLGPTCIISLAIMIVGVILDLVKLNALLTMAISWVRQETLIALGNLAFLLLLSLISLAAGFGFWSMTNESLETKRAQESLPFITARNNYQTADKQVNLLSQYATINLNDERAKLEALKMNIETFLSSTAKNSNGVSAGTVRSRIGDCSGNSYYERVYCGELRALQAQMIPLNQAIANAEAYQVALKARQQASQDLKATGKGNQFFTTPLYADLGKLIGKSPEETRLILMFLITLVIELTAIWCFINFNRLSYYHKPIEEPPHKMTDEPKKPNKPSVETPQQEAPIKWQISPVSSTFNFDTSLQSSSFARTENSASHDTTSNSQQENTVELVFRQEFTKNNTDLQHHKQKLFKQGNTKKPTNYLKRFMKFLTALK